MDTMLEAYLRIKLDPHLKREADEAAAQALSGDEPLIVNRMGTDVHIQRSTSDNLPDDLDMLYPGETGQETTSDEIEIEEGMLREYLIDGFGPFGVLLQKAREVLGDTAHGAREMDQEDWAEVMVKAGIKLSTAGVANEVLAEGQATVVSNEANSKAQDTATQAAGLQALGVAEGWSEILTESPSEWLTDVKQEAVKAAESVLGEGESQGVGTSGVVS